MVGLILVNECGKNEERSEPSIKTTETPTHYTNLQRKPAQRSFVFAHVLFVCIFIFNIVNGISKGDDK